MSWLKYKYELIPNRDKIELISREFRVNKYISAVLIQRFGCNVGEIYKFLNPSANDLHDPFLLTGIVECIDIIQHSITNCENILIYCDYDVDGITSASILYRFLQKNFKLAQRLIYRTASRFGNGYGLSVDDVKFAIDKSVRLIITVDCGTKDYEAISLAVENNIKVIVVDHHEFGDGQNCANVILNPKGIESTYPFKDLSGCGVVFKLLQALNVRLLGAKDDIYEYIDLLALSICCDIVPLVDENRVLLVKGLEKINLNPQLGLKYLICSSGLEGNVGVDDILFKIGPRINAPGRVGDPSVCVELFTSDDESRVVELVGEINNIYRIRKDLCNEALREIDSMISVNNECCEPVVVYKSDWNLGILGILAAKCVEKKYVPSVVMADKDSDYIVGSVRSVEGLDIVTVLGECKDLLVRFGGHKMAAGLLLERKNIYKFVSSFKDKVSALLKNSSFGESLDVNIKIPLRYITCEFYSDILKLSPFGFGNYSPVFESTVYFIGSMFYYRDTICRIKFGDGSICGIVNGKNILIRGYREIQYSVFSREGITLNILNILQE